MPDTGSHTPVGATPASGGRERRYANDAERARAWRERQKEKRVSTQSSGGEPVSPALAEATLSVLLERLTEAGRAHETAIGGLVSRVEDAVNALADPESVAETIAAMRAEAARQVAEAEERAARSSQAKTVAEAAARDALRDKHEAEAAANAAWERAEALEAQLDAARQELVLAAQNAEWEAARHDDEIQALRVAYIDQIDTERRKSEAALAEIQEATQAAIRAVAGEKDRAEGVASELRLELETQRQAADDLVARVQAEAAAARSELFDRLTRQHATEMEIAQAKSEADIARAQGEADSARQIAENRADEIARIMAQVDDLRAELRRARS